MKQWRLWLAIVVVLAAFIAGCLTGSGRFGPLGFGIRGAKDTTITLSQGQQGRCVSNTARQKLKVRRKAFIEWQINSSACRLPTGGSVQLRFAGTSPVYSERPTQSKNSIVDVVLPGAELGLYPYKVWADFPGEAGDYVMEDPELEIVQFSFF